MFDLADHFPCTALNSVLDPLVALLLPAADGDVALARDEAAAMLADYRPATREELRLAAEVVTFGFKALAFLGKSAQPDTPPLAAQDLVKAASTLQRNEASAQRKLDAQQRARRKAEQADAAPPQDAVAAPPQPAAQPVRQPPAPYPIAAAPGVPREDTLALFELMRDHGFSALLEEAARYATDPAAAQFGTDGPHTEDGTIGRGQEDWPAKADPMPATHAVAAATAEWAARHSG